MKRIIIIFFWIITTFFLFAESEYLEKEIIHTDEYSIFYISEDYIKFNDNIENGKFYQFDKYDVFRGSKKNYIILQTHLLDSYFVYVIKQYENPKQLYGCWEMTYSKRDGESSYNAAKLVPFKVIKADSFIIEKNKNGNEIRFLPENSNLFSLESNPWAVKKNDKKIIYINTERWRNPDIQYLPISDIVFVNGFVFPDKEYLYEQNARAKRVRISYNEITFDADLQDTGNFQVVHLPKTINPKEKNDIKIEIIDSYPGSKYSDIVISGIYYMDAICD